MNWVRGCIVALLMAAVAWTGCGSNSSAVDPGTHSALALYALNTSGRATDAFLGDTSTGALTPTGASQPAAPNPVDAVASANGKFLYIITGGSDQLSVYSIASDGSLTTAFAQAAPGMLPMGTRLMVRAGNRIFIAGLYSLAVMTIQDTNGAVIPLYTASFTASSAAHSMAVDPAGKFVYVLHDQIGYGTASLSVFSVDASTATLTQISGSPFSVQGPAGGLAIDNAGKFLYVTTYTALGAPPNDQILSFQIGSDGTPTKVGSLSTDWGPTSVAIHPTAEILFVGYSSASSSVKSFLMHPDGSLTATGESLALTTPAWDFALDPSGDFLFASIQGRGGIVAARITSGGGLTQVSGSPFASGVDYLALAAVRH